jgi:RND family efflux transporter MFP subunit
MCVPVGALGCNGSSQPTGQAKPPEVEVSTLVADSLTDFEVFTGHTQALLNVDIRAHVTGYLDQALFKEGDDVKKDDVLFVIDQRPFQAALNQAKANLAQQQAQLTYNQRDYERNVNLRPTGAASQDDLDKSLAARDVAQAAVGAAQAAVETAQLNLNYTKVLAPFSGRISRRQVDPGNLVQADNTVMASLVQLDPLYAYFDVNERSLLRLRDLLPEGKIPSDAAQRFPVTLGLANEDALSFSHKGAVKFTDNKVDPSTGTLRIWGTFDNPKHDLYPNLFIRVRMGIGEPRPALFVAEVALGSDQGRKYLYVVNEETQEDGTKRSVIARVDVEIGQRKNGRIAIERGLSGNERVVVKGLQLVKPQQEVVAKLVPMPRATTPPTTLPVVKGPGAGGVSQEPSPGK